MGENLVYIWWNRGKKREGRGIGFKLASEKLEEEEFAEKKEGKKWAIRWWFERENGREEREGDGKEEAEEKIR